MRSYRIVLRSGANIDITAELVRDEPEHEVIYFYSDERRETLACTVQRAEFAGLIIMPDFRTTRPLLRFT